MLELRGYQRGAVNSVFDYWAQGGGNPLVDLATGTGKSLINASIIKRLREQYPSERILCLTHVQELVQQNFLALMKVWPAASAGIYSAGMGRRDAHHPITFASIQSVHRRASELGPRALVLIDEAHLVPSAGEGMYRRLIDDLRKLRPDMRIAGLSATPYRLDTGRLDGGEGAMFDETVYTYGIAQAIGDGYLSPLVSKAGLAEIDVSQVQRRGGEFVPGQLQHAADAITAEAVAEIQTLAADRKSAIVFCAGVAHAEGVRDAFRAAGHTSECVTGDTPPAERAAILQRFKAGGIRYLTNAQVLTTGFDAPNVDLVVLLRSTLSTGLYVQMIGRGTRLAPGKENCLVLDFGGNIRRHGPVDMVEVESKGGKSDTGKVSVDSVMAKECPSCGSMEHIARRTCTACDFEFPIAEKPKHEGEAEGEVGILSSEKVKPVMLPVVNWTISEHRKRGVANAVPTMRVTIHAALDAVSEWVCFEHSGRARQNAINWWTQHGGSLPIPGTIEAAMARQGELIMPSSISVQPKGKYRKIVSRHFSQPEMAEAV